AATAKKDFFSCFWFWCLKNVVYSCCLLLIVTAQDECTFSIQPYQRSKDEQAVKLSGKGGLFSRSSNCYRLTTTNTLFLIREPVVILKGRRTMKCAGRSCRKNYLV
ncbi:MAG: hypothetical protein ACXWWA_08690, partial [Chitinophagaceae bacterium]